MELPSLVFVIEVSEILNCWAGSSKSLVKIWIILNGSKGHRGQIGIEQICIKGGHIIQSLNIRDHAYTSSFIK